MFMNVPAESTQANTYIQPDKRLHTTNKTIEVVLSVVLVIVRTEIYHKNYC